MYRVFLTLLALILAASPVITLPSHAQEASLEIIINEPECVANVVVDGNMLTPAEPGRYVAASSGDLASIIIQLKDLSCRASVEGELARNPFIEGGKLYVDVVMKKGVNVVRITFAYSRPPPVYVTITPTNPDCVANVTANAPVNNVNGSYVAGPWRKGSQAELSATPARECYIAGWMKGDKAVSKNEAYIFTAEENSTLTLSAERKGSSPPPQLIDFAYLSVTARGPGKVVVSTKPITGEILGTPLWEGVLAPGTTVYLEAVPEGCGRFVKWTGQKALEAVYTESVAINVPAGFVTIEAVFEEMSPCPYIAIGSTRLLHLNDLPLVVGVGGAAAAAAVVYRMVTSSRKREESRREVEEKWVNDVLKTNLAWASQGYKLLLELIDRYRPLSAGTLVVLLKSVQDGAMTELLEELDAARDIHQRLYLIYEYEAMGMKTAFNQGMWAGHLLTTLLAYRGYAPASQRVLNAWVKKMSVVSSSESADRNIELLWTDPELKALQEHELEELSEALRGEGVEHTMQNPPKPIAVLVEEVVETILSNRCPTCGAKVRPGSAYCITCGTRLLRHASKVKDEQVEERRMTEEAETSKPKPIKEEKAVDTVCPHCGKTVPKTRYCISCGALIERQALAKEAAAEGRHLREMLTQLRTRIPKPASQTTAETSEKLRLQQPQPPQPKPEASKPPTHTFEEPPTAPAEHPKPPTKPPEVGDTAETHSTKSKPAQEHIIQPMSVQSPTTRPAQGAVESHAEPAPTPVQSKAAAKPRWEIPRWIINNIEGLVDEDELRQAVESVAHEPDVDKAAYRAANMLAQRREFPTDGDRASFITSLSSVIPFAINEYRAALEQAEEESINEKGEAGHPKPAPEAEKEEPEQTKAKVRLQDLLKATPQKWTAYLVDDVAKAPTLPDQIMKNLLSDAPYRVITASELSKIDEMTGPVTVVVTLAVFSSNLIRRRAKPDGKYMKHIMDSGLRIALTRGYPLITHSKILDELKAAGYRRVWIDFGVKEVAKKLREKHPYLELLAPAEVLLPGLADAFVEGDHALRRLLMDRLADERLVFLFEKALKAVTSPATSQDRREARALLLALGLAKASEDNKEASENMVDGDE